MYVLIFMILVVNDIYYIRYQGYPVLITELLLYHYLKTKKRNKKKKLNMHLL